MHDYFVSSGGSFEFLSLSIYTFHGFLIFFRLFPEENLVDAKLVNLSWHFRFIMLCTISAETG